MASNYRNLHAVHALNRFLWSRIEAEGIMQKIAYQGVQLTPIVPVEETPELLTAIDATKGLGSVPFIVYNWTKIDNGQLWMIETNEIAYAIRSADDTVMRQLLNLFDDEFKDYDDSAQRLNLYLAGLPPTKLQEFDFKTISVSSLGGQMPVDEENGQNEAIVSIRAVFTQPIRR
jgi:hypothetical protein